eukprot:9212049-Alexandrium_andersonii.AAC.1
MSSVAVQFPCSFVSAAWEVRTPPMWWRTPTGSMPFPVCKCSYTATTLSPYTFAASRKAFCGRSESGAR